MPSITVTLLPPSDLDMTIMGMKKSRAISTGKNSVINMNIFFRTEARYSRLKTANILRMRGRVSEGIVLPVWITP